MTTVAHLTTGHGPADTRIFRKECAALVAAGYHVSLIVPADGDEDVDGVHVLAVRSSGGKLARLATVSYRVFQRAKALHADIYHFHDYELLPWALLLARCTGRKVIYDAHEYHPEYLTSRDWFPRLLRRPAVLALGWFEAWAASRLAGVVTVNEDLANRFSKVATHTAVVHNWPRLDYVGESQGSETVSDSGPAGPVENLDIVYVGVASDDRGINVMHQAMQLLAQRRPGCRCRIVGRVSAGRFAKIPLLTLNSEWKAIGLDVTGTVPFSEAMHQLQSAAVAWLPFQPTSLNAERGLPNKLFEYMAAGKPVVASNFGYMAEVVRNSGAGILVTPSDPEAHAAAIEHLLERPQEALAYGARGRESVLRNYNWATEEKELLQLYREVDGPMRLGGEDEL